MSLLLPGVASPRQSRISRLIFGWRAADGTIQPYVGPVGSYTAALSASGPVVGANGVSVTAGRAQPRFTMVLDNTLRLRLQGDVAGTYDEHVTYPLILPVQVLTLYGKLRSTYTLAAGGIADPGNFALSLGTLDTTAGGRLTISRLSGGVWRAQRTKVPGGTQAVNHTETGAWVHPFEFLLTLNADGSITFTIRDGGGTVRGTGTSAADPDLIVLTDFWAGNALHFGAGVSPNRGGDFDYQEVKLARGIQTLDAAVALF